MTVGVWQPGRTYPTGSLVRPTGGGAVVPSQVVNGTFESGDVDWTKGTGWTINSGDQPFQGSWSAKFSFTGTSNLDSQNDVPVTPGQSITCSAMVQQGASSAGQAGAKVILVWLDGSGAEVSTSEGNLVDSASGGAWKMSTVTATAPAGAERVFARVSAFRNSGSNPLWVDNVLWNYTVPNPGTGLIYQAVQPDTGTSASSEPAWPTVLGVQVNDGSVVWEAIGDTRIEWTARPILKSGATEPTWPTTPGEFVSDGNIAWECVVRNVTDERCPNTKVVLIAASKIFAVDEDIVAFSATVNPLDWSTQGDAGYLPTGLQQYGANPMTALGLYRGNLVAWNSQGMQIWQVDEDPARMQLLDALPIGSTYPKAVAPVQNDLLFLTELGVRSLGIAGGSVNLQAGDVGMPIDPLVREALITAQSEGKTGLATYFPAQGQYFLTFTTVPGEGIDISNPLEVAYVGVPVDHQYVVTGGIGPYEFVIDRGSLPPGLVMDSLGNITGTPTEEGEFAWRVRVYDSTLRSDALDEGINLDEGIDGGDEFFVKKYDYLALLHFDGNNADEVGNTWTGGQGAVTPVKFGTESRRINGHLSNVVTSTKFETQIGTGPFSIDCWIYRDSSAVGHSIDIILGHWYASGTRSLNWIIRRSTNIASIGLSSDGTAFTEVTGSISVPYDEWVHLRVTRDNDNVVRQFINGVVDGSATFAGALHENVGLGTNWIIGGNDSTIGIDPTQGLVGWVDEFAMFDICLSTEDFTPPVAPWPNP